MSTRLKEGQTAPAFELMDGEGKPHRLRDYKGKTVLLYFYPRDNTPGCTTEACNFAESHKDYLRRGVIILGVSTDSSKSHEKFAAKYNLPFPLLADTDAEVTRAYGALKSFVPLVKKSRRVSFLINGTGKIVKIWDPVSAKVHNEEVLSYLEDNPV